MSMRKLLGVMIATLLAASAAGSVEARADARLSARRVSLAKWSLRKFSGKAAVDSGSPDATHCLGLGEVRR